MGIASTEVCKNASKIILTNDNFCDILPAIKFGRNIYDNIMKFLQFQLTVNVAVMFLVLISAFSLHDQPFSAVQLLWINLIMDTFAALALATDPPNDQLLERKPHNKNETIINSVMWRNIFGHAIYQIIVLVTLYLVGMLNYVSNRKEQFFDN